MLSLLPSAAAIPSVPLVSLFTSSFILLSFLNCFRVVNVLPFSSISLSRVFEIIQKIKSHNNIGIDLHLAMYLNLKMR